MIYFIGRPQKDLFINLFIEDFWSFIFLLKILTFDHLRFQGPERYDSKTHTCNLHDAVIMRNVAKSSIAHETQSLDGVLLNIFV